MQGGGKPAAGAERQALRHEVARRCPGVDPGVIDELFGQLDADYFTLYTAPQIAAHVMLLARVNDRHPVQVRVIPRSAGSAEVLLAAYDLFGEFAIITGLTAAFGLSIVDGQVFSYRSGPGRTTPWGHTDVGLIIDIFTVEYAAEHPFDKAARVEFARQLTELIQLLRQGKLEATRERLNYRLIDSIRTLAQAFSARLSPVDIRIDNEVSPDWTVVHITADDTPGFLYSLANALAMRNIYIYRVSIKSIQGKVHDRLYLRWRHGGKITSAEGQRELRLIVVLIKQFTHFLTIAPDPVKALRHFDQLLDRLARTTSPGTSLRWLWEESTLKALATVLGSSDFLWEDFLRMQHATLLPMLKEMGETARHVDQAELAQRLQAALQAAESPATRKAALNAFKDREMFRIDMRHLLHLELPFGLFSEELTGLATVVVAGALDLAQAALQARHGRPLLADGTPCTFALLGLGKFGGGELGYASDIEMLCVYSGPGTTSGPQPLTVSEYAELLVQQLLDLIVARRSGIFEIDLRLRPFGSHGPLATSREAFQDYYRHGGQAAPFERQALIKLRRVAGDEALGRQLESHRDTFVYSPLPFDLKTAVHLRQRQLDELVTAGAIDAKYGRGGLIDTEYTVQYLQLRHGATNPTLRTTNTLEAMQALLTAGHLSPADHHHLHAAHVFLRHLIDALRIVRGNARDLVLPTTDADEFTFLARRMGYWEGHGTPAQLAEDITHHMQQAARLYTQYATALRAAP